MRKLARIASIVINVSETCEKYSLNEEDLLTSLLALLDSLQRFVFLSVLPIGDWYEISAIEFNPVNEASRAHM